MNQSRYSFKSVIFDLDGVITKTALVHAAAWKETFDEYLKLREERDGEPFKEFTHQNDYLPYVDGKPRYEGVDSFLRSRGIELDYGDPSDSSEKETVCGIGNRKNEKFREVLKKQGVEVYPSTIELIKKLTEDGVRIGAASSSKNCKYVLEAAGIEDLFESRVDGVVSAELGLKGKPEGDIFVKAAFDVGTIPAESIVVEDATSGVAAGRNGGFGLVLGIARENNQRELLKNGADIVVTDLSEITIDLIEQWFHRRPRPLMESWQQKAQRLEFLEGKEEKTKAVINDFYLRNSKKVFFGEKKPVFFLDYDGTLTPIVSRPELAKVSKEMQDTVKKLSQKYQTVIVSGRMREDVEDLLGIEGLIYAGSHGFDIKGPNTSMVEPQAEKTIPLISQITEILKKELEPLENVLIEEKKFSVAVHYRLAEDSVVPKIEELVNKLVKEHDSLRILEGKKVFEILPAIDWNKGKALIWIMRALNIGWEDSSVIYIGDDTTDEFAFRVLGSRGTGILVSEEEKNSWADFYLSSPKEVRELFEKVISH